MEAQGSKANRIQDVVARAIGDSIDATHRTTHFPAAHVPPADLKETGAEYVIFIDLPGIDEDGIEFNWDHERLTVSGNREFDHDGEDAEEYLRIERKYGQFSVSFEFEKPIDSDLATAKYKRGVLKVRLPKLKKQT